MTGFITKIKSSEFGMRIKEKLYPRYILGPTVGSRLVIERALKRFKECESKKSPSQIRAEIQSYKKFWKCYPYDYFVSNLYRKDTEITRNEIINYIPSFFWFFLFLPHHTSYKFSVITSNKIAAEQFFQSLDITQPKTLCKIINGNLYSPRMQRCTFNQIQHELNDNRYEKLFIKPALGGGSKGIYVFHKNESGVYTTRQNLIFNEDFLSGISRSKDYILQPGVAQDERISKVYPGSVNTCRILTENLEGESRAVCGVLRIGRGWNDVDNVSAGGLFVNIDIRTGQIGDQAMSYEYESFLKHPDTEFIFQNFKIPCWNDILKFTEESADKLPFFGHLGWDIALTNNGPMAIETNLNPAIEVFQILDKGKREQFAITDPDYYWENPGKRI